MELEDISWGENFEEFARQWLLVGRREAYRNRAAGNIGYGCRLAVLRVIAEFGRLTLQRAPKRPQAADSGRLGSWRQRPGRMPRPARVEAQRQRADERAAADLEADRRQLVKVATRLKTPQTKTTLRENAGLGHGKRITDL